MVQLENITCPTSELIVLVVELLEKVRGETPEAPPSAWKALALGRLPHKGLENWVERNGHDSPRTASLVPLNGAFGLRDTEEV